MLLLLAPEDLAIPSRVFYKLLPTEKDCLAWVIHDEARGEPLRGARAVLDAVLARAKKRQKPVCEVVSEPRQFSGYSPEKIFFVDEKMLQRYREVAELRPVAEGCDYFHATYVKPRWRYSMKVCRQVGKHIFYKEKRK